MSKHVHLSSELKVFIEELFITHYEMFQLYAYKLCKSYSYPLTIAGDMVMDTFFKVLNGNLKIDTSSKSKAVSIFKMKIKNNFIDHCRKEKSIQNCNSNFVYKHSIREVNFNIDQAQDTIVESLWEQIENILDSEQELSLFKDYHSGVKYNEMAVLHDMKQNTVATRIRRIKNKLQAVLEEERY